MAFEKLVKIARNITDTTVKKTGEQVQITKLALAKSGLEKELIELYTTIGRQCCEMRQNGEPLEEALDAACAEVAALKDKIADLENEIDSHKTERDGARYRFNFEEEAAKDAGEEIGIDEDVADLAEEAAEEVAEAAEDVLEPGEEAAEEVLDAVEEAAEDVGEAVQETVEEAAEAVADAAEELTEEP